MIVNFKFFSVYCANVSDVPFRRLQINEIALILDNYRKKIKVAGTKAIQV